MHKVSRILVESAWRLIIGLLLDKPSIGCAKTRLIGDYNEMGEEVGCYSHLTVQDKVVGAVLRTRKNVLSLPVTK
jgi:deoxyinosine 3'endonuclease (endonuclease V)